MFETPLFSSETIELTVIEIEKDSATESRWTHDLKYAGRRWASGIAKPAATFELKKDWEERIKTANEKSSVLILLSEKEMNQNHCLDSSSCIGLNGRTRLLIFPYYLKTMKLKRNLEMTRFTY